MSTHKAGPAQPNRRTETGPFVVPEGVVQTGTISGTKRITGVATEFTEQGFRREWVYAAGQVREVLHVYAPLDLEVTVAFSPAIAPGTAFQLIRNSDLPLEIGIGNVSGATIQVDGQDMIVGETDNWRNELALRPIAGDATGGNARISTTG